MNIYPMKFPYFLQKAFPTVMFTKTVIPHTVYLTFDDGPTPGITEWVLDLLDEFDAGATFFCIGDRIRRYKKTINKILEHGHVIANHSYFHRDGWYLTTREFVEDVERTETFIQNFTRNKKLFRPPYGHITFMQYEALKKLDYKIVLWTNMSGDFSPDLNVENTIWSVSKKTKAGDILLFHDSKQAQKNLKAILPKILYNLKLKGYEFGTL